MHVTKHDIHLFEGLALGLREEEEGPHGGSDHPACEEEPCSVAEGLEDVGESLGDGELGEPVAVSYRSLGGVYRRLTIEHRLHM